jgi:hypothetical protein
MFYPLDHRDYNLSLSQFPVQADPVKFGQYDLKIFVGLSLLFLLFFTNSITGRKESGFF